MDKHQDVVKRQKMLAEIETCIRHLNALQEIRVVKARYARYMNLRRWGDWYELFTDDCVLDWPELQVHIEGTAELRRRWPADYVSSANAHHVHSAEIEIIDESNAKGIFALRVAAWRPVDPSFNSRLRSYGSGHYINEFKKVNGRWLIHRFLLSQSYKDVESYSRGVLPEVMPPNA